MRWSTEGREQKGRSAIFGSLMANLMDVLLQLFLAFHHLLFISDERAYNVDVPYISQSALLLTAVFFCS